MSEETVLPESVTRIPLDTQGKQLLVLAFPEGTSAETVQESTLRVAALVRQLMEQEFHVLVLGVEHGVEIRLERLEA